MTSSAGQRIKYQAQSRRTGSGPPVIDELSHIEEVVQQTLVAKQVEGVDSIDTAEISAESEGVCGLLRYCCVGSMYV